MIYVQTQIPSLEVLQQMEDVHPEAIRWDIRDKEAHVKHFKTYPYWLYENDKCIGEYITSVKWGEYTLRGDSISILPEYSGKGYARALTEYVLEDAHSNGFTRYRGEARPGASWHIIESLGAVQTGISVNHGGTGEDYIEFCLELK